MERIGERLTAHLREHTSNWPQRSESIPYTYDGQRLKIDTYQLSRQKNIIDWQQQTLKELDEKIHTLTLLLELLSSYE